MWPIVQPGIAVGAEIAALVAIGLNASPRAHTTARKSLITPSRYGDGINRVKPAAPFRANVHFGWKADIKRNRSHHLPPPAFPGSVGTECRRMSRIRSNRL